ncbi:MAG: outer membrane lipoprotein-sorting protein [Proteobacteria bacterium]|nr:outer membrane lipoprotein-sorting protein [Pseudomonadota bacterium]
MKSTAIWAAALAVILVLALAPAPGASQEYELTGREILDRVDDLYRGDSAKGIMTMRIVTEHWTRALTLEFWAKGKDMTLIRILAPEKEKGTATLRRENEIWNFLPKVNRVIKLPSSMMSASWMGSHFTNDDLVKESRMTQDYDFSITFQGEREGLEVVEITCIPKPDAAVVWGKVVVEVRREDYLPTRSLYFDEDMDLARTMEFSDIRDLGGRNLPAQMTITPQDKPGEKTSMTYESLDFGLDLDDAFFSLRTLRD